jgi:tetratricopeptide (TPR) repeat protein
MPLNAEVEVNVGFTLAAQGKYDEAIPHYRRAIELQPRSDRAHYTLSQALAALGRHEEATSELRTTVRLNPDYFLALNDLAWILATNPDAKVRNGTEAVELAERACRLMGDQDPLFVGTLAAAYAEAGRFEAAVQTAEKAERLASATGRDDLAKRNAQLQELYQLYRAGKAYRETN